MDQTQPLHSIVGVYHADGGPIGEARYVIGKLLGTAHCALCDITHSPVRRKPEWDRMVAELGLPVELVHLNEMDAAVSAATAAHGSPLVLGRRRDGTVDALLLPHELEVLGGSVAAFRSALADALSRRARSEGAPDAAA